MEEKKIMAASGLWGKLHNVIITLNERWTINKELLQKRMKGTYFAGLPTDSNYLQEDKELEKLN